MKVFAIWLKVSRLSLSVNASLLSLILALALAPFTTPLYAQATSTVNGTVSDPSGAAVSGATVTMTDRATNSPRVATTNETGRFVFVETPPGIYDFSFTKSGFRSTKVPGQRVTVGNQLTVNVSLEVGTISQTVEVTATRGAELQTENATMGSTVTNQMLLTLPNLNRDAASILTLQPATAPAVGGGDIYGGQVAGSLSDQNTYMLDGGNITSDLEGDNNYTNNGVGGMGAIPTPLESIEEFKVATNNQTADFFSSAGGQVMMVSKRGTNSYHGSAYEYYQSQLLDANSWSNNRLGHPIVKFHDNRFGGGVGGPLISRNTLGGKTYFYGFYEGHRFPGTAQEETWTVPSALMRQGILQWRDSNNVVHQVNLATDTTCGDGTQACDPRGIGINPLVQQFWNKYLPPPTCPSCAGDNLNTEGFQAAVVLPVRDDYGALRIDHDFGDKWRLSLSYRIFNDIAPSTNQIDIGGLLPGDKLGVPRAVSSNPTLPRYFVLGLTGTITPNLVNEFHGSYLLNRWFWQRQGVTNALANVPAGIEFSDSHFGCMCPLNMDTQDSRSRVWNGHDWNYSDTLSWIRGSHYMQFGGTTVHWWDHHVRDDQVVAGLPELVYQLNKATGMVTSAANRPNGLPSNLNSSWDTLYAQTLGILGTSAQLFVRGGSDFHLTGAKTFADTSIINSYSLFYNDSWKIRRSLTINYGLEWGTQMPPYEINGVQDVAVDGSGNPINSEAYLQNTVSMALKGQVYNPVIGFEPIGAVGGHPKYPFNPYYGGFSPRVAVAWNPTFQSGILSRMFGQGKTVIRAGFSRIYDRNNGVDLVLVPLLGYGFGQTIRCNGAGIIGGTSSCYGGSSTTPLNAFRVGVDGNTGPFPVVQQTLPLPAEPGVNSPAGGNISFLDNNWRPGANNQVTFGIQRELPDNMLIEVAYVGKWSNHLYQGLDLNDVPWMMTRGGQSFAKAYAALWQADHNGQAAATQAFFENSLPAAYLSAANAQINKYNTKNPSTPLPICTTMTCAVQTTEGSGPIGTGNLPTEGVYGMWQDMDTGSACSPSCPFLFGTSLPADLQGYNSMLANTTLGFSNYQAGIVRLQKSTGHGLTLNANLTWSHTLSTVGINQEYTQANPSVPFDLRYDYGAAPFDTRWVFNMLGSYQLPFGKGKWLATSNGVLDRVIGGWTFAPIFQWNSGLVMETYTGSCDEFGQGNVPFCSGFIPLSGVNLSSISRTAHTGVVTTSNIGSNGNPANGGAGVNLFSDPAAVYNSFRPVILGLDGRANDLGPLYGQHRWNLDFTIAKTTNITERFGFTFYAQFFNAFNHMEFSDPGQYGSGGLNLQDPNNFGVINGQFNSPRHIELGMRFFF
ncbi:MAG TPA: carboxypeptidase-like regulatory domain-containing protein [Candidatus Acidoferrum sp.]|nr:carboxypeptidase-like regulatory domain-containing protein [Candidatus Acidoferrum sp.]